MTLKFGFETGWKMDENKIWYAFDSLSSKLKSLEALERKMQWKFRNRVIKYIWYWLTSD